MKYFIENFNFTGNPPEPSSVPRMIDSSHRSLSQSSSTSGLLSRHPRKRRLIYMGEYFHLLLTGTF